MTEPEGGYKNVTSSPNTNMKAFSTNPSLVMDYELLLIDLVSNQIIKHELSTQTNRGFGGRKNLREQSGGLGSYFSLMMIPGVALEFIALVLPPFHEFSPRWLFDVSKPQPSAKSRTHTISRASEQRSIISRRGASETPDLRSVLTQILERQDLAWHRPRRRKRRPPTGPTNEKVIQATAVAAVNQASKITWWERPPTGHATLFLLVINPASSRKNQGNSCGHQAKNSQKFNRPPWRTMAVISTIPLDSWAKWPRRTKQVSTPFYTLYISCDKSFWCKTHWHLIHHHLWEAKTTSKRRLGAERDRQTLTNMKLSLSKDTRLPDHYESYASIMCFFRRHFYVFGVISFLILALRICEWKERMTVKHVIQKTSAAGTWWRSLNTIWYSFCIITRLNFNEAIKVCESLCSIL